MDFNTSVLTFVFGGIAMDDSEDETPFQRQKRIRRGNEPVGKQGQYKLPQKGLFWIWNMTSGYYTGLSVMDFAANQTICCVDFDSPIKSALKTRGRRSQTLLPDDDRYLLKAECQNGLRMTFQNGTAVDAETTCLPLQPTIRDVEHMVKCSCPWNTPSAHRVELAVSSKRLSERLVAAQNSEVGEDQSQTSLSLASASALVISTGAGAQPNMVSLIARLITSIGSVLQQLNQTQAVSDLNQLTQFLQVALLD